MRGDELDASSTSTAGVRTTTPSTDQSPASRVQMLRDLETPLSRIWTRTGLARSQTSSAHSSINRTWPAARDLTPYPSDATADHRRGTVRSPPGPHGKQPPAMTLLGCLHHREAGVLRFLKRLCYTGDIQPGRTRPASQPRLSRRSPDGSEVIARDQYAVRGCAHPLPSNTDRRLRRHPRRARRKSLDIDDPGQHRSHAEIPHPRQLRYPGRRELLQLNDLNVARQNDRARCFAPGAYSQPTCSDYYLGTNPYLP